MSIRLGTVGLLIAAFAVSFSALVQNSDRDGTKGYHARCHVSSDPACFGPVRR